VDQERIDQKKFEEYYRGLTGEVRVFAEKCSIGSADPATTKRNIIIAVMTALGKAKSRIAAEAGVCEILT
jgi:hypothetical protein